jgi:hypothetical protein
MQLGPGYAGTEPRPIGTQGAEPKAGGINQVYGICHPLAEPAFAAVHQFGQQTAEYGAGTSSIRVGQRRARRFASAQMIKLAGVAGETGLDRSQALAARQLGVQQGDELILRR